MAQNDGKYSVVRKMPGGKLATFRLVQDPDAGQLFLWFEPGMDPEEIISFYRITRKGEIPIESWQTFQEGDAIAPFAGERGAMLGAIEQLETGQYQVDSRVFTGLRTIELPAIEIDFQVLAEDPVIAEARLSFNSSFTSLFHKFIELRVNDKDVREYVDTFADDQLDFLMQAIVDLGAPDAYVGDDETNDVSGYFDFVDFLTALIHSCGGPALQMLNQRPDSPTNRHYIKYIKQYLADDRRLAAILEKYPFCKPG